MSKKVLVGEVKRVISKSSVVVLIEHSKRHPRYQKILKRSKRVMADNDLDLSVGNLVELVEARPLSKRKRFVVREVLKSYGPEKN